MLLLLKMCWTGKNSGNDPRSEQSQSQGFYDTQNYYLFSGLNPAKVLEDIAGEVAQIHIKDGYNSKISSALLGQGTPPLWRRPKSLKDAVYQMAASGELLCPDARQKGS